MWILIIVFANLSTGNAASSITTQEFQSKQACEAGKDFIMSALGPDTKRMNALSQNAYQSGTSQGPETIVLKAACTRK